MKISPGVTTFLNPYFSATRRQPSPSPPATSTHLFSSALSSSGPLTSSAKGEWLWIMTDESNATFNFSLISATRSVSCLPPPLVSRMKGMPCSFKMARESAAPGIGFEDRRRTPSMLNQCVSPERQNFGYLHTSQSLTQRQRRSPECGWN